MSKKAKAAKGGDSASLWTKAGACMSALALVVTLFPANAIADTGTSSASGQGTQQNSQPASPSSGSSDQQNAQGQGGTPPEKPDGSDSQNGGTPPEKPDGDDSQQGGAPPSGGGANTQSFDYSGSYTGAKSADGASTDVSNESVSATDSDQNALLAQNGGTLNVTGATVSKSGDSDNADNCNFYGTNSGILAVGESSKAYVSDSSISTSAQGANGIFATDNAQVYVNNSSIDTSSTDGNARGLDATYGGTIVANKMTVSTAGQHCAAAATDRGGGNVSLTNSSLSTSGSGSPLLYSTGDIEVENVSGTASGSQIAGMEGLNSILVSNSTLESTSNAVSGSDPIKNGVIIYQSTSGDADTSTGSAAQFTAKDSTLKTSIDSGAMFYLTNTTANVVLDNSTLDFDSSKVKLLQVEGNDANNWGTAGKNGATVNFTLSNQTASGDVSVDDISTANVYLTNKSTWTGTAGITTNSASNKSTSKTPLTVNVGEDSTWVVTADATVSELNVASGGKVVDSSGKTVTVRANGKTVVKGDSEYTVTVKGSYSTKVKTTDANKAASASIDRTDFDNHYSVQTSFGNNTFGSAQGADAGVVSASASASQVSTNPIIAFFQGIWNSLTSGN